MSISELPFSSPLIHDILGILVQCQESLRKELESFQYIFICAVFDKRGSLSSILKMSGTDRNVIFQVRGSSTAEEKNSDSGTTSLPESFTRNKIVLVSFA